MFSTRELRMAYASVALIFLSRRWFIGAAAGLLDDAPLAVVERWRETLAGAGLGGDGAFA